ncbi:MAG TPA: DUF5808 domain-containing protein [Gemmatimonadales bacterium]|jgi:hypothetical protein|nr:DUF5808 domain-containing protein [Gemmatimonadales bacterium]
MASVELERLWQDPRYWSPPGIYRCAADPRLIVPKRRRWAGWTLNFAHRAAWLVLLGAVVVAVGPAMIVLATGQAGAPTVLGAVAGSVLVLSLGSAWESERRR